MVRRNTAIDLFKCLLMVGICMRHSVVYSGLANGCEARLWSWAVPAFAFISGYYGVRFSGRKILNLFMIAACSAVVPAIIVGFRDGGGGFMTYRDCLLSNWYLNAYLVIILMSPIINAGLDVAKRTPFVLLPLCGLMNWSWLSEQWGTREWVPHLHGIGQQSFFALLYAYVLAWFYREFELRKYMTIKRCAIIGVVALGLMPFLGMNTSPVTLTFVVILFAIFERLRIPVALERMISFVLPSVFSIYLLHTNAIGFSFIHDFCARATRDWGLPNYGAFLLCSLTVFVGCLALDAPRRVLAHVCTFAFSIGSKESRLKRTERRKDVPARK